MTEFILPPSIGPASVEWELVDFSSIFPNTFGGAPKTYDRGQRWLAKIAYQNVSQADRATMMRFAAGLRGKANRTWVWDPSYTQRGSFPGGELLTNADFSNGTTGWAAATATMIASKGSMRVTNTKASGTADFFVEQTNVPVTQYAPHILRGAIGQMSPNTLASSTGIFSTPLSGTYAVAGPRLVTQTIIPPGSTIAQVAPGVFDSTGLVTTADDWGEVSYATLQRCALLDAGVNAFQYSMDFTQSAWTKQNTTALAANHTGPWGGSTAGTLIETTANGVHSVYQSAANAATQDWFICVALHPGGLANARNFAFLYLTDLGSNAATVSFNLTTGAIVSAASGAGTVTNARAGSDATLGNGYVYCWLVATIPSSITTLYGRLLMSTDGTTVSYTGSATGDIIVSAMTFGPGGVPGQLVQTGATAYPAGSLIPVVGNSIPMKGLPINTNGLLLAGDMFEINGELKRALSDLNSSGAGLGTITFEPSLRSASFADSAPVIFGRPLGKFALMQNAAWPTRPGFFSDFSLTLGEAA